MEEYVSIHRLLCNGWKVRVRLGDLPELITDITTYKIVLNSGMFSLWKFVKKDGRLIRVSKDCTILAREVQEIIAALYEQEQAIGLTELDVDWCGVILARIDSKTIKTLKQGWPFYKPTGWGMFTDEHNTIVARDGFTIIMSDESIDVPTVKVSYLGKTLNIPKAIQHELAIIITEGSNCLELWQYLIDSCEDFLYWFK